MADFENIDFEKVPADTGNTRRQKGEEVYDAADLMPGGQGKQGNQQQMGQRDREMRKDKSHNRGGTDKEHLP